METAGVRLAGRFAMPNCRPCAAWNREGRWRIATAGGVQVRRGLHLPPLAAICLIAALVCGVTLEETRAQEPSSPTSPAAEPSEVQEEGETPDRANAEEQRPATRAYKRFYFDNDFSYLRDPANREIYLGDYFKQRRIGRDGLLDLGGEYRLRDQHEFDLRGRNLSGTSDDFLLQRTRFYGNLAYGDGLRLYGEALDSATSFQRHAPLPTEENGIEALNLFADLRLADAQGGELRGRIGRQELAYGSERLVSPALWNNVLRTFDGAKLFWRGDDWDIDAFWVRPVAFGAVRQRLIPPGRLDLTEDFYGAWSSYHGWEKQTLDAYYLGLTVYDAPVSAAFPVNSSFQTIGSRWQGRQNDLLWDIEGAYQFGRYASAEQSAAMATGGIGYQFAESKTKPELWLFYDYATGNASPRSERHGTFSQLFPWGHHYLGFMDLVGRQNIRDLNLRASASPSEKTNLLLWYHVFHLAQARDALYNASGAPIRISPSGSAGTYVGQELDLLFQFVFNPRSDVIFGYSHFFAGSFVKATNPPGVSGNANFYYSQWSWRF